MSSKTKKGKKKTKTGNDVTRSKDTKIFAYFTNEEIAEIKTILKTKDVTGVPFVIGATLLYKFDLLKKLLKDGYNVNQTGQNNMTSLMWAVKNKQFDIIDYLLNNGADPTIKTDSGDNVLILALEHKLWDEPSIIELWKAVKRVSFIDVNFTSKNGHNMIHMCVRRDWEELLRLLLIEKPDVDAGNSNGVTPLMLASFRNNLTIIETLLSAGADIVKEDNHGRVSLCYAISSCVKMNKPSFLATDRIVAEMRKKHLLEQYFKRRLQIVIDRAQKSEVSCTTSEALIRIIRFSVQYIEESICVFLECDVFAQLLEIIETYLDNDGITKFLLEACEEILLYNEHCAGYKPDLHNQLLRKFYENGWVDVVLEVMRRCNDESRTAFELLTLSLTNDDHWMKIIGENSDVLVIHMADTQTLSQDENKTNILKNRKRRLKKIIDCLDVAPASSQVAILPKKARRRPKAKLTKTKSAQPTPPADNPIVESLHYLLDSDINIRDVFPKWKHRIATMSQVDVSQKFPVDNRRLTQAVNHLQECCSSQTYDTNVSRSVTIITDYLRHLIQVTIRKYREHWDNDNFSGRCTCHETNGHVPWLYSQHLKMLEAREKQVVQDLQKNFDELVKNVKDSAQKNLNLCFQNLTKLESTILNHEIRGIKVLSYIPGNETFTMRYTTNNPNLGTKDVIQHVQNVVNNLEEPRLDIDIEIVEDLETISFSETYRSEIQDELYSQEMLAVPKVARKEKEAKCKTMSESYHLINSIMAICDDGDGPSRVYDPSDLDIDAKDSDSSSEHASQKDVPSRLTVQVLTLQNNPKKQKFLGGAVRTAPREERFTYIIGPGINFAAPEIALTRNDQPLAVRRAKNDTWIGKMLKHLLTPIIGFVHEHVLPYFACEYEGDELIVATPLCMWNLGQYVQILKQANPETKPQLTADGVIRQFLKGLRALHTHETPIVHGNLKPSNVFIDFNGVVKIGEFGMHKALYKLIDAPKSALIWFATETLAFYKSMSMMECSLTADIQVAGMLIHYIWTYGRHAFGDGTEEIIKNIRKRTTKLLSSDTNLNDLLLWMLESTLSERPDVEQAMAHPYFWDDAKKWDFIHCCSGVKVEISPNDVEKIHASIDMVCDNYLDIYWHEVITSKFPAVTITESDTVVGLLRFIKKCQEQDLGIDSDLSQNVLFLWPVLPSVLYRVLEETKWINHDVFKPFSGEF